MTHRRSQRADESLNNYQNDRSRSPLPRSFSQTTIPRDRFSTTHRVHRSCSYQLLCREFLSSLGWSELFFNTHHDRCYCSNCYSENKCDSYLICNGPYVIPRGWVRFGLHVDNVKAQVEDIWNSWHNTYHGTNIDAAESIISHGQFLLTGDTCEDGRQLKSKCPHLYTSPTIKYSARNAYAKPSNFTSSNGDRYEAKLVLQCKQKPGTYKIQGATGRARFDGKLCNVISNDQIEYYTEIRASVVPYGIMVRLVSID